MKNKTLETLEVGDRVYKEGGGWREVLAVLNRNGYKTVYSMSAYNDDKQAYGENTAWELKDYDYTIKEQEPEPKEMTVAQVCEALGREVKIIK